jgi:hypothetical protein
MPANHARSEVDVNVAENAAREQSKRRDPDGASLVEGD